MSGLNLDTRTSRTLSRTLSPKKKTKDVFGLFQKKKKRYQTIFLAEGTVFLYASSFK